VKSLVCLLIAVQMREDIRPEEVQKEVFRPGDERLIKGSQGFPAFRGRLMKSKQARKEKRGRTSKKTSHVTTILYQCDLKRSIGGVRCLIRTHYGNGNRQCQGTYRT